MASKERISYVATEDNPADRASQGFSVGDHDKVKRWFNGPSMKSIVFSNGR